MGVLGDGGNSTVNVTVGPTASPATMAERAALMDLYRSCHGPQWRMLTGAPEVVGKWGGGDPCEWSGFTCNDTRVVFIDLEQPSMACELPPSLSALTELRTLDISGRLVGTVPSSLRAFRRLRHLKLYQNEITGTLPEWLSELTDLEEIAIVPAHGSVLHGMHGTIPASYSQLTKLKIFVVDENRLSGEIPMWVTFVNFRHLLRNNFTGPCPVDHMTKADQYGDALFHIGVAINCPTPPPTPKPTPLYVNASQRQNDMRSQQNGTSGLAADVPAERKPSNVVERRIFN